jgi:hypothetical protein
VAQESPERKPFIGKYICSVTHNTSSRKLGIKLQNIECMRRRTQLKDASEKAAENASENSAVNNTGGGLTSISLKIIHPLSMILFHSPIATCNSLWLFLDGRGLTVGAYKYTLAVPCYLQTIVNKQFDSLMFMHFE